jgi:hypothetical protein
MTLRRAAEAVIVVYAVADIRVKHTFGAPLDVLLYRYAENWPSLAPRIREELQKQGAVMTPKEIGTAMLTAITLGL